MSHFPPPVGSSNILPALPLQAKETVTPAATLAQRILPLLGKILACLVIARVGYWLIDRYLITHEKPAEKQIPLSDLQPSSSLTVDQQQRAKQVIELVVRHEAVLERWEQKIPGLMKQIRAALTSKSFEEVMGCESIFSTHSNQLPFIKLGENGWIFPKGIDGRVVIHRGVTSGVPANYHLCYTILEQLIGPNSLPTTDTLRLTVNNDQVEKVDSWIRGNWVNVHLAAPVKFACEPAMPMIPLIPASFTESQKRIAEILINTVWVSEPDLRQQLIRDIESFPKTLKFLQSLIRKSAPYGLKVSGAFNENEPIQLTEELCSRFINDSFVENFGWKQHEVFQLEDICSSFSVKGGVKITGPDGEWLVVTQETYQKMREVIVLSLKTDKQNVPEEIRSLRIGHQRVFFDGVEIALTSDSLFVWEKYRV